MRRFLPLCVILLGCSQSAPGPGDGGLGGEGGELPSLGGEGGGAGAGGTPVDCPVTLGGGNEPLFDQTTNLFRLGLFPDFLTFKGAIFDGPPLTLHEEADRSEQCRLLTYEPSFCDPACSDGLICVQEQCTSYPASISAGEIELDGVGPAVITAIPVDRASPAHDRILGQYEWSTSEFGADGVEPFVTLSAPGADVPEFSLKACAASEPPAPSEDWSELMLARAPGEDVVLAWSNPVPSARIYLRMTTGIGTHGGISPVEIECEAADTGTLTLPGAHLDALYADGWSCGECGGNTVTRYHATQVEVGTTTVQLRTEANAYFGFIP